MNAKIEQLKSAAVEAQRKDQNSDEARAAQRAYDLAVDQAESEEQASARQKETATAGDVVTPQSDGYHYLISGKAREYLVNIPRESRAVTLEGKPHKLYYLVTVGQPLTTVHAIPYDPAKHTLLSADL